MVRELPPELATLVTAELASGERIAWTGQPSLQTIPAASVPLMLFGLPWTAFSVFWMWAASGGLRNHAPTPEAPAWSPVDLISIVFPLFGLPFVIIGLGLLTSPYWIRRAARRTAYVISDRRAFILNRGRITRVRCFQGSVLGMLEHREREDGSGDIVLQPSTGSGKQSTPEVAFERVPEVKRVLALLAGLPKS